MASNGYSIHPLSTFLYFCRIQLFLLKRKYFFLRHYSQNARNRVLFHFWCQNLGIEYGVKILQIVFTKEFFLLIYCFFTENFAKVAAAKISRYLAERIANLVSSWYYYLYDGLSSYQINDGGNDMYDDGNRVRKL